MPRSGIDARFRLVRPGFTLDVELCAPENGVTVLFGHSGSGKTSLLRCIAGLERAPGGYLSFKGEVWQDAEHFVPTHQRPLGVVFQEASLFPHLDVLGNLRYGMARTRTARQFSLEHAIALLGIEHLLERRVDHLSGGERQRVAIARALAVSPRLLLMDEPLAALDLPRKQEILPYLERLHAETDIPVIYVSHSPDEVARLADHIAVLDQGRIVASGDLSSVLGRVDLPIRIGEDAGVVFATTVVERDTTWHLARVEFCGGHLWLRDHGHAIGSRLRVRILARDVSIALRRTDEASFLNILPATVARLSPDAHPATALIDLTVGPARLLARITRRAVHRMQITPGKAVSIQIKAVEPMV